METGKLFGGPKVLEDAGDLKFLLPEFYTLILWQLVIRGIDACYFTGFFGLTTDPSPERQLRPHEEGRNIFQVRPAKWFAGPHMPAFGCKISQNELWLCNSGFGEVGYLDMPLTGDVNFSKFVPVATLPGFIRV